MPAGSKGPSLLATELASVASIDGVTSYVLIDNAGIPLKWVGFAATEAGYADVVHTAALASAFITKARQNVKVLLENDLTCVRMCTDKHELIIAPGPNVTLVVFQAVGRRGEQPVPIIEDAEGMG